MDTERDGDGGEALIDAPVRAGTRRGYSAGDVLCREDDESEEAFVVIDGSVDARVIGHSGAMTVATHGPRSIVGEVTTLIGGRRTATLVATDTTTVAAIGRDDLYPACSTNTPRKQAAVMLACA